MIGVVDYRTGNSQSVIFALNHLGVANRLVTSPAECSDVDRFILPGVGSANVTMDSLKERGWDTYLSERVLGEGTPFLGICVGLQVLFEWSAEGDTQCLGWLPGQVRAFDSLAQRVPHMGWNTVDPKSEHAFARSIGPGTHYYFVNSYYAEATDAQDVAGSTEYGVRFASAVARRNIMATQFHTEKSGALGLKLLSAFVSLPKDELC